MLELKYFDKIEHYDESERRHEVEYPPFDIKDLGTDNNFRRAGRWLQRHAFIFIGWFLRTLWPLPTFRIGRTIIVGGYDDVVEVLKNRDDFRVPFGLEMMAITDRTNFVLGLDGQEHDAQRKLMSAAVRRDDDLQRILGTTRYFTAKLLASSGGQIDVMRDLLGRVFTESADEYFGLDLDDPNAFLDRSFAISNVIFADPFGSKTARRAAISGAVRFRYLIDRAIDRAQANPRDAYIDRLVAAKRTLDGGTLSKASKDEIRSIVIGTLTGLIPTNTLGAGKILEELLRHPAHFARAKQIARACETAPDEASRQHNRQLLKAILFEAARLNPALFPGQWRHAPHDTQIGGKKVRAGSVLMVATMSALRDRRVFAEPDRFWPERGNSDKAWLMFGTASHECFGIWLAMEQFTEIFAILLSQPDIAPSRQENGWSTYIGPFPRRLDMLFTTDVAPRKQEMITIQARVRPDMKLEDLQRQLAALGNPASHDSGLGKALRQTNLVHFASLSAFDAKDPDDDEAKPDPRLVFEINADGDGERALEIIADVAHDELQPIFARTLGGDQPLLDVLRRQRVTLTYSPWQTIGLNFNGLPDCCVKDVAMQERIADEARSAVIEHVTVHGAPGNRPMAVLRAVRQKLREKGFGDDLIRPSRRRLGITEWTGTGNSVGLSALFASRPALYLKILLGMLLLGQGALIYHFIVEDAYAHWIAGAAFFYILFMLVGASLKASYKEWLILYWARARYVFAHAVVGLMVVATVAAVALLTWGNMGAINFLLTFIAPGWPPVLVQAIAAVGGLALLRVEYVWGVWLLDRGRDAFGVLRSITLAAIALVAVAGAWRAVTHWDQTWTNAAKIFSGTDLTALGQDFIRLLVLDNTFLQESVATLSWIFYAAAGAIASTALGGAVLIGLFLAILRWHEINDKVDERPAKISKIKDIARLENAPGYAMNHILAVTPMKTGWFRKLTLAVALAGIGKLVQYWYRPGFVLNMGTIHYARWFRLPASDQLVFFSNYDGSWESYLEDFITKAHKGQTAAWTNGRGFPPTRYLINGGAEDGARFKRWVRRQQQVTPFWFARFPHLTTDQIRNNAVIHDGLMRAATDTAAEAWLSCFGSMPRPESTIEMQEVQSIVFRGFPSHPYGAMAAITLPPGAEARKAHDWLRMVEQHVWFGETRISQFGPPCFVSFSATGLAKLLDASGVDGDEEDDLLSPFPPAFRIGMGNRAKILRDLEASAPECWRWSDADDEPHGRRAVDAVILVYGESAEACREEIARHRLELEKTFGAPGESWSWEQLETQPTRKTMAAENLDSHGRPKAIYEHFGFKDGISQPVIRGTQKSMRSVAPADLVEAGEIVLGYKNNAGQLVPPLTLPAEIDTHDNLPMEVANFGLRFPRFGAARTAGLRDFGRNGSFIVVRQYEQHVDRFDRFVEGWVHELTRDRKEVDPNLKESRVETLVGCPIDEDWVAAKLMGRRRDGQPLIGRVIRRNDNDFTFGTDDPQGLHCPFGAHMRRANPRGGMNPDDPMEIDITKRHRILRRGRAYESSYPGEPGKQEKGLLFIGLCADIERQFEFLQQSWISSPSFQGLSDEPDPITATTGGVFTIPTTAGPIRLKRPESFVTVRAGGYFFMPSRAALGLLVSRTHALPKA